MDDLIVLTCPSSVVVANCVCVCELSLLALRSTVSLLYSGKCPFVVGNTDDVSTSTPVILVSLSYVFESPHFLLCYFFYLFFACTSHLLFPILPIFFYLLFLPIFYAFFLYYFFTYFLRIFCLYPSCVESIPPSSFQLKERMDLLF